MYILRCVFQKFHFDLIPPGFDFNLVCLCITQVTDELRTRLRRPPFGLRIKDWRPLLTGLAPTGGDVNGAENNCESKIPPSAQGPAPKSRLLVIGIIPVCYHEFHVAAGTCARSHKCILAKRA